jgi:GT2 family glycosyltransferase
MASIDVIVPCYNYGRYLASAVGSALDQPGVDVRILVIDNASEDNSLAVARELSARDPRVQVLARATNQGATASYNAGLDWAAADYLLVLDADDMLAPGALARAAALLDANPDVVFVHGCESRLQPDGTLHPPLDTPEVPHPVPQFECGREFVARLCRHPVNSVGANTVVRRTTTQKRVGHYNPALPYTDDLEMWLRLAMQGRVAFTPAVQAIRRYHPERMSMFYQSVQVRDFVEREKAFISFFGAAGRTLPEAPTLVQAMHRGLGAHAYWSAASHFVRGQYGTAGQLLELSLKWRPSALILPPVRWLFRMARPVERLRVVLRQGVANAVYLITPQRGPNNSQNRAN